MQNKTTTCKIKLYMQKKPDMQKRKNDTRKNHIPCKKTKIHPNQNDMPTTTKSKCNDPRTDGPLKMICVCVPGLGC